MSEVLLLSGGIDSIALAAWLRPRFCLTIDYGQIPAAAEIAAASAVCSSLGLTHGIVRAPIRELGCGTLAGFPQSSVSSHTEFWPFRNQFLVTLAAMAAIRGSCSTVLIGTVVSDKRHADGDKTFVKSLNALLQLQEGAVALRAPAISMSTVDLVRKSKIDLSVLAWAHSCHISNVACGYCTGCTKHSAVMEAIGLNR